MSHRHQAVLTWMLANPDRKLSECATELGYTRAWISCIVHSDVFQSALARHQEQIMEGTVLSLNEKLTGIAHEAADQLMEQLEHTAEPKFLLETMDKTLSKLGYGAPRAGTNIFMPGAQQQNNTVTPDILAKAREAAAQKAASTNACEVSGEGTEDEGCAQVFIEAGASEEAQDEQ